MSQDTHGYRTRLPNGLYRDSEFDDGRPDPAEYADLGDDTGWPDPCEDWPQ